jgi:hypothetical protein
MKKKWGNEEVREWDTEVSKPGQPGLHLNGAIHLRIVLIEEAARVICIGSIPTGWGFHGDVIEHLPQTSGLLSTIEKQDPMTAEEALIEKKKDTSD